MNILINKFKPEDFCQLCGSLMTGHCYVCKKRLCWQCDRINWYTCYGPTVVCKKCNVLDNVIDYYRDSFR